MAISPILLPSRDRVIALSNHIPPRSYGVATPPVLIQLPTRRGVDVVDYWLDCGAILGPDAGDHVTDVRTVVEPDAVAEDLTVELVTAADHKTGIVLAGGRDGVEYLVTVTLDTFSGRTVSCEIAAPIDGTGIPADDEDAETWDQDAPLLLRFHRGDAITLSCHFTDDADADIDVSGAVITGVVRTANGRTVLGTFSFQQTNLNAWSIASIATTAAWPLGQHIADLRVAFAGGTVLSDTFPIFIDLPRVPE